MTRAAFNRMRCRCLQLLTLGGVCWVLMEGSDIVVGTDGAARAQSDHHISVRAVRSTSAAPPPQPSVLTPPSAHVAVAPHDSTATAAPAAQPGGIATAATTQPAVHGGVRAVQDTAMPTRPAHEALRVRRFNATVDLTHVEPAVVDGIAAAMQRYDDAPLDLSTIPVYTTLCVAAVDCLWVRHQLTSFDTGVGRIAILVNRDVNGTWLDYFRRVAAAVPQGRMHVVEGNRSFGMGCAEAWNSLLRWGFDSAQPRAAFVMVTNGDFFWRPTALRRIAVHVRAGLTSTVGSKLAHWSSFAINQRGWDTAGPFDENVWPAYYEDDEYMLRLMALGERMALLPEYIAKHHEHIDGGSQSKRDARFIEWFDRWDGVEYLLRKWGVNLLALPRINHHIDYAHVREVFASPWNASDLKPSDWVLDPVHRHCIQTGVGPTYDVPLFMRLDTRNKNRVTKCWFNASVLQPLLPAGARVPKPALLKMCLTPCWDAA